MTTPTVSAELPEALRPIQRYKIGYATDDWGMRSSSPGGIPDASGSWVRYADHVAQVEALSAAQAGVPASLAGPMQFGGCPECGSRACVARECSRTVSHKAQAIPGIQWQCGQQASRFAAPQPAPYVPNDAEIAAYGAKASRMMARDMTRFDAACEVDKYLREQGAPGYYRHRMSIVLFGNAEGTEASRAPDSDAPQPATADAVDAARYRWWRQFFDSVESMPNALLDVRNSAELDTAIDTLRAAQREVKP